MAPARQLHRLPAGCRHAPVCAPRALPRRGTGSPPVAISATCRTLRAAPCELRDRLAAHSAMGENTACLIRLASPMPPCWPGANHRKIGTPRAFRGLLAELQQHRNIQLHPRAVDEMVMHAIHGRRSGLSPAPLMATDRPIAQANGYKLRLYGNGWNQHPQLCQSSPPVPQSRAMSALVIPLTSKINMQIIEPVFCIPAALDGMAAGGFPHAAPPTKPCGDIASPPGLATCISLRPQSVHRKPRPARKFPRSASPVNSGSPQRGCLRIGAGVIFPPRRTSPRAGALFTETPPRVSFFPPVRPDRLYGYANRRSPLGRAASWPTTRCVRTLAAPDVARCGS